MKKNSLNGNGITLVALIITIIVLLILAGVSISMLLGENGLINKSQSAVNKYKEAEIQQDAWMNEAENYLETLLGTRQNTPNFSKNIQTVILPEESQTVEYKAENDLHEIDIPDGYHEKIYVDASNAYKAGYLKGKQEFQTGSVEFTNIRDSWQSKAITFEEEFDTIPTKIYFENGLGSGLVSMHASDITTTGMTVNARCSYSTWYGRTITVNYLVFK